MLDLQNIDCMELMKQYPDKYFDLAIVDPPYTDDTNGLKMGVERTEFHYETFNAPDGKYFAELFRVSKNQIIWGANHFLGKTSPCWIVWDKQNGDNDFADCEMAWASFGTAVRRFKFRWAGMLQGNMKDKEIRMHPTQKPVALYDFIYSRYATEGMKVLDTHLGSGSSRIAANKANLHFVGCEIDEEYFNKQNKRYDEFVSQARLF